MPGPDEYAFCTLEQNTQTQSVDQFQLSASNSDIIDVNPDYKLSPDISRTIGAFSENDQIGVPASIVPSLPAPNQQFPIVSAKPLCDAYAGELADPRHRMSAVLNMVYVHVFSKQSANKDHKVFYKWLDQFGAFKLVPLLQVAWLMDEGKNTLVNNKWVRIPSSNVAGAKKWARLVAPSFAKGVSYLSAAARKSYKAKVVGGLLQFQGAPLDTARMKTVFSGLGWGIWVMSPLTGKKNRHKFYTNSHVWGGFHHSSFLEGTAIIAGGEWKVTGGVIQYMTGKTGHYKTSMEALTAAIVELRDKGAQLGTTKVVTWPSPDSKPEACSVDDFLADKDGVRTDASRSAHGLEPFTGAVAPTRPRITLGGHRGLNAANPATTAPAGGVGYGHTPTNVKG